MTDKVVISAKDKNAAVYTVLLLSTVCWVGVALQISTDPFITKDLKLDTVHFGYIQTALAASQMLGNPIYSNLCGKYLKFSLAIAFLSSAASYFLTAISSNFTMLLLSRVICFMAQAPIGLQTAISVVSTTEERTSMFSKLGATFGAGFIFGSFLGGVLANFIGYYYPSFLTGMACVLVVPLIYKYIPDKSTSEQEDRDAAAPSSSLLFEYRRLLTNKKVVIMLLTKNLCLMPLLIFTVIFGVYLVEQYGISPGDNAILSVYVGISMTLMNAVGVGLLQSKFTEQTLVHIGCGCVMVTGFFLALVSEYWHFFIVMALLASSMTLISTICDSLLSTSVEASDQALAVGLIWAMDSLVRLIAPTAATLMLNHLGFVSFGIAAVVGSGLAWLLFYSHQITSKIKPD